MGPLILIPATRRQREWAWDRHDGPTPRIGLSGDDAAAGRPCPARENGSRTGAFLRDIRGGRARPAQATAGVGLGGDMDPARDRERYPSRAAVFTGFTKW